MGKEETERWGRLRFFEGRWKGTGTGRVGTSTVEREYRFVLSGQFLEVKNRSVYEPQEANPEGEVHEDLGFYSYDKERGLYVLRQFHVEGFVNQYVHQLGEGEDEPLVFISENIENLPEGFSARETYRLLGEDEFVETFDLASPGKSFECYIENRLHRVQSAQGNVP